MAKHVSTSDHLAALQAAANAAALKHGALLRATEKAAAKYKAAHEACLAFEAMLTLINHEQARPMSDYELSVAIAFAK